MSLKPSMEDLNNFYFNSFTLCLVQFTLAKQICVHFQCGMRAGFVVFHTLLPTMSGIKNGRQHCYLNALLQCMSVNNTLIAALTIHSRHHVEDIGKF